MGFLASEGGAQSESIGIKGGHDGDISGKRKEKPHSDPFFFFFFFFFVPTILAKSDFEVNTKRNAQSSHHGSAETNLTSIHEDRGSIPGFTQWIKDLVLPWAVA